MSAACVNTSSSISGEKPFEISMISRAASLLHISEAMIGNGVMTALAVIGAGCFCLATYERHRRVIVENYYVGILLKSNADEAANISLCYSVTSSALIAHAISSPKW